MVGARASASILAALDDGALSLGGAQEIVATAAEDQDRELAQCRGIAAGAHTGPAGNPEKPKALWPSGEQPLRRVVKRLLLALKVPLPRLRELSSAMDIATLHSCRTYLRRVHASIAQALDILEEELRNRDK
jgi:hypothetical protein